MCFNLLEAILLGILQGITEFLPISSSGHLVLAKKLLGVESPGVTLEIMLHLGTLFAVIWVYREDFGQLLSYRYRSIQQIKLIVLLFLGTLTTGTVGYFLYPFIDLAFQSLKMVGIMLFISGILIWTISRIPSGYKKMKDFSVYDAIWIGLMQGLAVLPGLSRSGATIWGALSRKLNREIAIKYSFMLSAPVILGATLLELKDMYIIGVDKFAWEVYLTGIVLSFLSGIFAIKIFIKLLVQGKFLYFAYYCWFIGAFIIILSYFHPMK